MRPRIKPGPFLLCGAVGALHKTTQRQLRDVSNIGIAEMTMAAHRQHGGNALQIQDPVSQPASCGLHP
jgi:hypothetical protein